MHLTRGRKVVVFDRFQQYVEIVRKLMKKYSFIFQLKEQGQVWCKVIETTLQCQTLFDIGNLLWFLAKNLVTILIVPSLWLNFDDITVTLYLKVLL